MIDFYELAAADPAVRFSPYCWRVRMALAHKGVHARMLPWHFGDKRLPGGNKQVPVVVDDGRVIADSTAIAFHLEEKYHNGPSLFGGEGGEAHARFIVAWTDTVLQPALLPIVAPDAVKILRADAQAGFQEVRETRMGMSFEQARERRASLIEGARSVMAPMRLVLAETEYLGGSEPSYADYTAFGSFQWTRCSSKVELLDHDDPVCAWRERMLDLFGDFARSAKLAA